jgi:hypothetical protein
MIVGQTLMGDMEGYIRDKEHELMAMEDDYPRAKERKLLSEIAYVNEAIRTWQSIAGSGPENRASQNNFFVKWDIVAVLSGVENPGGFMWHPERPRRRPMRANSK